VQLRRRDDRELVAAALGERAHRGAERHARILLGGLLARLHHRVRAVEQARDVEAHDRGGHEPERDSAEYRPPIVGSPATIARKPCAFAAARASSPGR